MKINVSGEKDSHKIYVKLLWLVLRKPKWKKILQLKIKLKLKKDVVLISSILTKSQINFLEK